jgi:phenylalanyl-tRNA synthetase beta chain
MKLSPHWIRDFVDLNVDDRQLARDLTDAGAAVEGISGHGESMIFEMEITTNRPDEMNHYGIAREASAIYDLPLKPFAPFLPAETPGPSFPIEIQEPGLCPRFTARAIRNTATKASPARVVDRLALLDQRAINNAVDATNYVLWEIGKPTHVFDLDLLEGGKLIIRRARKGELLKTLDGIERRLSIDDLVVADARKAVGLAGVMGGFDTMITANTRNILIESAWWDPVVVRRMAKRHGLHTDASHRFERGADIESTIASTNRVAELILASGGGALSGDVVDVVARQVVQPFIEMHFDEVRRMLGSAVDPAQVVRILKRLGFISESQTAAALTVRVPSWRLDVEREIDLIEEIARIYGYNKFSNTLPAYSGAVVELPEAEKDQNVRSTWLALGYNEAVSLSFVSGRDAEAFSSSQGLELENPLSAEASMMRTSLVPGMLDMLAFNLNRGNDDVRLFEMGHIYESRASGHIEPKHLVAGVTGSTLPSPLHGAARPISFFDLKGDVENLLGSFEYKEMKFEPGAAAYYHPGRSATAILDGERVAEFGEIHPDMAAARKLRQYVYLAEVRLDRLYRRGLRTIQYEPLPRYPSIKRDFSFTFPDEINFERIKGTVSHLHIAEMRNFMPVEIFRGGSIPPGKYAMLLRATFQSNQRTLREEEVAQWSQSIIRSLSALDGTLRA